MFDCKNLLHPFQNDPGTSQRQRIADQLASSAVKIDGRSLADLLNYFASLSVGINYYDKNLGVGDWQPFFRKSLPFLLASISKFDYNTRQEKFDLYKTLFDKATASSGLQLIIHYIYYNTVAKIDEWYNEIKDHDLPIRVILQDLISNKLSKDLQEFIPLVNASSKWFGTKRIDFSSLLHNGEDNFWGLTLPVIHSVKDDFMREAVGRCDQMKLLFGKLIAFFPSFLEAMKSIRVAAEGDIQASLIPLGEEFKKNHPPHLALIFAFIHLFTKMQDELNTKTKLHLKYFYNDVLQIKPRPAETDKANMFFEVQKIVQDQYQKYLVKKGTALNGGRDSKNADIVFATDDEIVVNEAKVVEQKTLFLNNKIIDKQRFLEGVYMAPAANKADGVEKDFKDGKTPNWFTLGRNISKYTSPGKKTPKLHPSARLGFVLGSPVMYLKEGERTVTITLGCRMDIACIGEDYKDLVNARLLYKKVRRLIGKKFVLINDDLIQVAIDKGIGSLTIQALKDLLPDTAVPGCSPTLVKQSSIVITEAKWRVKFFNALDANTKTAIAEIFKVSQVLNLAFSGEKDWITPRNVKISMNPLIPVAGEFVLTIKAKLSADQPGIVFFDKEKLGENIGTILPAARIELNDTIKLLRGFDLPQRVCCLKKGMDGKKKPISFYHFFRSLKVVQTVSGKKTGISVNVCGLKNFLVQNEENVMDVNSIVYPFGTRPKVNANFYISSREMFCKNWSEFVVRFRWKDLPDKLEQYYHGYEDFLNNIKNADFVKGNYFFRPVIIGRGCLEALCTGAERAFCFGQSGHLFSSKTR